MTYMEEFDQKKNKRKVAESIEEDLRSNDFSYSKKHARDDKSDEILDEVPSV